MNKKIIVLILSTLFISNSLVIVGNLKTVKEMSKLEDDKKQLEEESKELQKNLKDSQVHEKFLNQKISAMENNDPDALKMIGRNFILGFYNYNSLEKSKIYVNIEPFVTQELLDELKPKSGDYLESDTLYSSSVGNVSLYYNEEYRGQEASLLAVFEQTLEVNGKSTVNTNSVRLRLIFDDETKSFKISDVKNL